MSHRCINAVDGAATLMWAWKLATSCGWLIAETQDVTRSLTQRHCVMAPIPSLAQLSCASTGSLLRPLIKLAPVFEPSSSSGPEDVVFVNNNEWRNKKLVLCVCLKLSSRSQKDCLQIQTSRSDHYFLTFTLRRQLQIFDSYWVVDMKPRFILWHETSIYSVICKFILCYNKPEALPPFYCTSVIAGLVTPAFSINFSSRLNDFGDDESGEGNTLPF